MNEKNVSQILNTGSGTGCKPTMVFAGTESYPAGESQTDKGFGDQAAARHARSIEGPIMTVA